LGEGKTIPHSGVCVWLDPVFEAVGCGEIQRDTADTAGYRQIHIYNGIQWICSEMARCIEIPGIQEDTGGVQGNTAKYPKDMTPGVKGALQLLMNRRR